MGWAKLIVFNINRVAEVAKLNEFLVVISMHMSTTIVAVLCCANLVPIELSIEESHGRSGDDLTR